MKNGSERRIMNLIKQGELNIVYSEEVLTEYILAPTNMILNANPKKVDKHSIKNCAYQISSTVSKFIFENGTKVDTKTNGQYFKNDSSDDKFINLAIDANVKYLVSVDPHLYDDINVKNKKGEDIIVVNPYQFEQLYKLQKRNWNSV
jgi:predicted nucleic acid-binding protein